jgi:hypothetical protein
VDNSERLPPQSYRACDPAGMDTLWTLRVLGAGSENLQLLAAGTARTWAGAVAAASDALVVAAMDRGRQEYRIDVADTRAIVVPGLTDQGEVDLLDLTDTIRSILHDPWPSPDEPGRTWESPLWESPFSCRR